MALTGTQAGTVQSYENGSAVTAADVLVPFSHSVVVTGLTVGTAYWVDAAAESLGAVSTGATGASGTISTIVRPSTPAV